MIDLPNKIMKNKQRLAFLLSITSISHFVGLQTIPMQELREVIELELLNDKYITSLNNLTDDELSLKISKNRFYSTKLTLTRYSFRPFEVEVMVDYTLSNEQDIVRRKIPTPTHPTSLIDRFMNYRLLWFGMFFLGLVFMVFSVFVSILFSLLERITPSTNPLQLSLAVIGAVIITSIFWLFMIPFIKKQHRQRMIKYDLEIISKTCEILKILNEKLQDRTLFRCWSCFKEINKSEKLCASCGEHQN